MTKLKKIEELENFDIVEVEQPRRQTMRELVDELSTNISAPPLENYIIDGYSTITGSQLPVPTGLTSSASIRYSGSTAAFEHSINIQQENFNQRNRFFKNDL